MRVRIATILLALMLVFSVGVAGVRAWGLLYSDDTEVSTTDNWVWQKVKSWTSTVSGTLQVDFDMWADGAEGWGYGRIYRNGSPVGTQQDAGTEYETFSENIDGWSVGDNVELWLYSYSVETAYARNFRIYGETPNNSPPFENAGGIDGENFVDWLVSAYTSLMGDAFWVLLLVIVIALVWVKTRSIGPTMGVAIIGSAIFSRIFYSPILQSMFMWLAVIGVAVVLFRIAVKVR